MTFSQKRPLTDPLFIATSRGKSDACSTVITNQSLRLNNIDIHKLVIKSIYVIDGQNRNTDKGAEAYHV